jgi:hypothetical protein
MSRSKAAVPFIRNEETQFGDLKLPAAVVAAIQTKRSQLCDIGVQHAQTDTEKNLIKLVGQFIQEIARRDSLVNDLRESYENECEHEHQHSEGGDYMKAAYHKHRRETFAEAIHILTGEVVS